MKKSTKKSLIWIGSIVVVLILISFLYLNSSHSAITYFYDKKVGGVTISISKLTFLSSLFQSTKQTIMPSSTSINLGSPITLTDTHYSDDSNYLTHGNIKKITFRFSSANCNNCFDNAFADIVTDWGAYVTIVNDKTFTPTALGTYQTETQYIFADSHTLTEPGTSFTVVSSGGGGSTTPVCIDSNTVCNNGYNNGVCPIDNIADCPGSQTCSSGVCSGGVTPICTKPAVCLNPTTTPTSDGYGTIVTTTPCDSNCIPGTATYTTTCANNSYVTGQSTSTTFITGLGSCTLLPPVTTNLTCADVGGNACTSGLICYNKQCIQPNCNGPQLCGDNTTVIATCDGMVGGNGVLNAVTPTVTCPGITPTPNPTPIPTTTSVPDNSTNTTTCYALDSNSTCITAITNTTVCPDGFTTDDTICAANTTNWFLIISLAVLTILILVAVILVIRHFQK